MNRCTSGLRSLIDADAVGVDDGVRDRPVLDDPAVDEDVLRPARRPLLGQRRDVAGQPQAAGLLAHLDAGRRARRRADTADRAAMAAGGHCSTVRPRARQREADLGIRQRELRRRCATPAPTRRASDFRNFRRAGRL